MEGGEKRRGLSLLAKEEGSKAEHGRGREGGFATATGYIVLYHPWPLVYE